MTQVSRRWWLLASMGVPVAAALNARGLEVRLDRNFLRISAPGIGFLSGRPLARLKDGATVVFLGQLSISTDANITVQARTLARFALSYDIWEERFSVTRVLIAKNETAPRTVSHLGLEPAQAWCLENLLLEAAVLPADRPFWIRLEIRTEDSRDTGIVGDPGLNLTRLVEIFSRPARTSQERWQLDAGPMRLADLRKS